MVGTTIAIDPSMKPRYQVYDSCYRLVMAEYPTRRGAESLLARMAAKGVRVDSLSVRVAP